MGMAMVMAIGMEMGDENGDGDGDGEGMGIGEYDLPVISHMCHTFASFTSEHIDISTQNTNND